MDNQSVSQPPARPRHSPLLVSVGAVCQTAYQINRHTRRDDALFFDWIGSFGDAYKSIFLEDAEFLRPHHWEIVDYGGMRVLDKGTGLKYQHDFPVIDKVDNLIDPAQVEAHLATARAKALHLKHKTLARIGEAEAVFLIRYEEIASLERALERLADIRAHFCRLNPKVKVVIASPVVEREVTVGEGWVVKIEPGVEWSGDDKSWDRLFGIILA
jgi:hypothetical protein